MEGAQIPVVSQLRLSPLFQNYAHNMSNNQGGVFLYNQDLGWVLRYFPDGRVTATFLFMVVFFVPDFSGISI
jgi:hypothetical protein